MPSTGIGVYPGSLTAVENDEVSSTYLGRHLTFLASDITGQEHTLVTKGHPVVIGEHIVGVAFMTEVLGSDLIPIDTEGIWNLMVYPKDDLGAIDVDAGDELWINKSNAEISKIRNSVTHTRFGYALGNVTTVVGNEVIAVKVHWDGDDELEQIGLTGAPFVSAEEDRVFRSYFYESQGGGIVEGSRMELNITTLSHVTACVDYRRLILDGAYAGAGRLITGRSSVIEARLEITAGDADLRTMSVLCLDFSNLNTYTINNVSNAYILLRERSTSPLSLMNLLIFHDTAAIPDAGAFANVIFLDTNTDHAMNCAIRCGYGPTMTPFWIMCTTTPPD